MSDMFLDRTKCSPTEMKDYSPEWLPSQGGRVNQDLLVGQWSWAAHEKLCRLTRKPARRNDEKPGPQAALATWAISCGHHCLSGSNKNDTSDLVRSKVDSTISMLNETQRSLMT